MSKNNWTGERLETFIFNDTALEHLHRYGLASSFSANKVVLDIASGEGYGSNLLAKNAKRVIGVDIDSETVVLAQKKYVRSNLEFNTGSAAQIPLADHSIDLVVSFETIEHHDKHHEMMSEIKRVMKPDGLLIISSPDKRTYTDLRKYNNPFHVKELYLEEFKALIALYFSQSCFYSQKIIAGSIVFPEEQSSHYDEYEGNYNAIQQVEDRVGIYNICIAGNYPLPPLGISIFNAKADMEKEIVERITRSYSYRLGHMLLAPFRIFKRK